MQISAVATPNRKQAERQRRSCSSLLMKNIFLCLVFTLAMLYQEVLEGVILTLALSKREKTLAEFSLQSVCYVAGKLTQRYDFILLFTWHFIVLCFVALLRNKDKLTTGYSLGSRSQKRCSWLGQVIIVNRPLNTIAAVPETS